MQFSPSLAALLCFTTGITLIHTTHGRVAHCCNQWSNTRVPFKRIVSYTIQSKGICPISAVIVQTVLGKKLCSDPNSNWTKQAMLKVDTESKALLVKGQSEEGSAGDMTTAAFTTPKNAPRRRGKGRRCLRKKYGKGKKRQRQQARGMTRQIKATTVDNYSSV